MLRAELTCERQRPARVGDVVDDEKPVGAEKRQIGHGRKQERLVQPLVDSGVELDVERRHVLDAERVRKCAGARQSAAGERKHRVRAKTVGPDLRSEVVDGHAEVLPRHLLAHNRENPIDGNRAGRGSACS